MKMSQKAFLKARAEARRLVPVLDRQIRAVAAEVANVRKLIRSCAKALRK